VVTMLFVRPIISSMVLTLLKMQKLRLIVFSN